MPKDALTIYRSAEELDMLVGGRVDKVAMPNGDTMILLFHTSAGNHRLLISCNPSLPRVHITKLTYKNPEAATGTLMYFRKRLTGAVLEAVEKDKCERMITFRFSAFDELRERVKYALVAELTGKCANVVFVENNGKIGNCLRRIYAEAPGKRAVFPGLDYAMPNPTGRIGVFDRNGLKARIAEAGDVKLSFAADKCVAGLASSTVNELVYSLGLCEENARNADAADKFIDGAQALYYAPLAPSVTFDGEKPLDFYLKPYATCAGTVRRFSTLNEAMDEYYSKLFSASDLAAYIKPLKNAVKSAVTKNKKRLADAVQKLAESEMCDRDRILGELITANIYRIKRGDRSVTVQNYYDENGGTIDIALDVTKNAQQNAAAYYKAYNKKKKAAVYAEAQKKAAAEALDTLVGISSELELCTDKRELDEVRAELVSLGLIRPETKKRKEKPTPSEPYKFDVSGATLLVGKNHAQNDRITRGAAKTDIWLHVKDAHGCHAVLKTSSPTDEQLLRAAQIAAFYSEMRGADNVAVDYTAAKHVFSHGGGKAEYFEYKTIIVTPKK